MKILGLSLFRYFLTAWSGRGGSECPPFTHMARWPQPDGAGAGNNSFLWKRNKVGSPQNDLIVSNETATEKVKRNKYMCWGFGELTGFMPKSCMALRGGDIIS